MKTLRLLAPRVAGLPTRLSAVVFAACTTFAASPLSAQLLNAELSGYVTSFGGDRSILGDGIDVGVPLHLSFSYDAVMTPQQSSATSAVYLATGPGRQATVSVGAFSYTIPNVSLRIVSHIWYSTDIFTGYADFLELRTLTTTGVEDTAMWATFLYPLGTWQSHEPTLPPPGAILTDLFAQRYYPMDPIGRGVSVRSRWLGEPPGPITPVPESNAMAIVAALLLAGAVAVRPRRAGLFRQRST